MSITIERLNKHLEDLRWMIINDLDLFSDSHEPQAASEERAPLMRKITKIKEECSNGVVTNDGSS